MYQNRPGKRRRKRRRIWGIAAAAIIMVGLIFAAEYLLRGENISLLSTAAYPEDCPQELLDIAKKNPETEDFVRNYDKEKDKTHTINLEDEVEQGEIPLFMQWDERWGYEYYGDEMIAINGCGPTCLSMVLCGLSGDAQWSPLEVAHRAEEGGFCVSGSGSSWSLMSEGAEELGLTVHKIRFEENVIVDTLEDGMPIICIMGPGDFTTSGHFIVLCGVDRKGRIEVHDPFRKCNSEKKWELEDIMPQIRDLWAYSL